jgi:hypothetical protein
MFALHRSPRVLCAVTCALAACVALWRPPIARACTSAVVAPRAAREGRPLLWKHRDSESVHNEVVLRTDGRYRYVGVINAGDDAGREIWMGLNERGLAVMNTASDDLAQGDLPRDGEGRMLKVLLQSCASVEDVEAWVRETDPGGRDVNANLGVIDARGRAVMYEVGQRSHRAYDADRSKRPDGYVVRTNFALTAPPDKGGGYLRFERASALFARQRARGLLSAEYILGGPSLDLANALTGIDPRRAMTPGGYIDARDTINRTYSVSDAVFEGASPNEPPHAAVMWVALGQPLTALAVPVWPVAQQLPAALNGTPRAGLELRADAIRRAIYRGRRGNLDVYLDAKKALRAREILDAEQRRIFALARERRRVLAARGELTPAALSGITSQAVELAEAGLERAMRAVGAKLDDAQAAPKGVAQDHETCGCPR